MMNNLILVETVNQIYESLKHAHHDQRTHNPHKKGGNFSQKTKDVIDKPLSDYTDLWDKSLSIPYSSDDTPETTAMSDKISKLNSKLQKKLEKQYQDWSDNLSVDELVAFQDYTSNDSELGYREINDMLRKEYGDERLEVYVQNMDNAINRSQLKKDYILRRGIFLKDVHPLYQQLTSMQEGDVWEDKGYTSASLGRGFEGNINFEIRIPKGSKAAYLGFEEINDIFYQENEVILPRNTKLYINSVSTIDSITTIDATVLPQE